MKIPLWIPAAECRRRHRDEVVAHGRGGRWLQEFGLSSEKTVLITKYTEALYLFINLGEKVIAMPAFLNLWFITYQ